MQLQQKFQNTGILKSNPNIIQNTLKNNNTGGNDNYYSYMQASFTPNQTKFAPIQLKAMGNLIKAISKQSTNEKLNNNEQELVNQFKQECKNKTLNFNDCVNEIAKAYHTIKVTNGTKSDEIATKFLKYVDDIQEKNDQSIDNKNNIQGDISSDTQSVIIENKEINLFQPQNQNSQQKILNDSKQVKQTESEGCDLPDCSGCDADGVEVLSKCIGCIVCCPCMCVGMCCND